jgi:hypothetical protein
MSVCGNLTLAQDLTASCGNVGGVHASVYIFNWNDVTFSLGSAGQVTGVAFRNTCAKGYKVTTRDQANEWKAEFSKTNGAPGFTHSLMLRGSVATYLQVEGLNNLLRASRLVAFVQNNSADANSFVVLGYENGIAATNGVNQSAQNAADLNAFELTLSGFDPNLERVVVFSGSTGTADDILELDNLTVNRIAQGATAVLPYDNSYTYNQGSSIFISGCNLKQVTSVVIATKSIPVPAGLNSGGFHFTVTTPLADDSLEIVVTAAGSTVTSADCVINFQDGSDSTLVPSNGNFVVAP